MFEPMNPLPRLPVQPRQLFNRSGCDQSSNIPPIYAARLGGTVGCCVSPFEFLCQWVAELMGANDSTESRCFNTSDSSPTFPKGSIF